MWRHRPGSTLVHEMACCQSLNQLQRVWVSSVGNGSKKYLSQLKTIRGVNKSNQNSQVVIHGKENIKRGMKLFQ